MNLCLNPLSDRRQDKDMASGFSGCFPVPVLGSVRLQITAAYQGDLKSTFLSIAPDGSLFFDKPFPRFFVQYG